MVYTCVITDKAEAVLELLKKHDVVILSLGDEEFWLYACKVQAIDVVYRLRKSFSNEVLLHSDELLCVQIFFGNATLLRQNVHVALNKSLYE